MLIHHSCSIDDRLLSVSLHAADLSDTDWPSEVAGPIAMGCGCRQTARCSSSPRRGSLLVDWNKRLAVREHNADPVFGADVKSDLGFVGLNSASRAPVMFCMEFFGRPEHSVLKLGGSTCTSGGCGCHRKGCVGDREAGICRKYSASCCWPEPSHQLQKLLLNLHVQMRWWWSKGCCKPPRTSSSLTLLHRRELSVLFNWLIQRALVLVQVRDDNSVIGQYLHWTESLSEYFFVCAPSKGKLYCEFCQYRGCVLY